MFETLLPIIGSLASGAMQAGAAEDAANIQDRATARSEERLDRQYNQNRADLAPWRSAGGAAVTKLSQLLGLGGGSSGRSLDQIVSELRSSGRYSTSAPAQPGTFEERMRVAVANGVIPPSTAEAILTNVQGGMAEGDALANYGVDMPFYGAQARPSVDESGLMEEAQRIFSSQGGGGEGDLTRRMTISDLMSDPIIASSGIAQSLRGVDPQQLNKKFTTADFGADPVVQLAMKYGQEQGQRAIENRARATGLMNTGGTLKELTRFGTDYAGGMAEGSRGRFIEDQDRLFQRMAYGDTLNLGGYDRFTGDQNKIYGMLSGLAGTGQSAANTTAGLGAANANTISGLISSMGNARAASSIAGGNAWGNAFNTAQNNYNQQGMLDKILNTGGVAGRGSSYPTTWSFGSMGDR